MEKLGIALIGCGFIGRTHAGVLKALLELELAPLELVVACDSDGERATAFREEFGFRVAETDARAAITMADVTVVYICTPTDQHMTLVTEAVRAGRAIFCEKPLAHTAAQALEIAQMVRAAGLSAQVGLVLRWSPVFQQIHSLLAGEPPMQDAGRPMAVVFRDDQCFPVDGIYRSRWRGEVAVAGGGTMIEHSIHDLDLLRWFFGEPVHLWARRSHFGGRAGVEDVATVMMEFKSGVHATLSSIWHQMASRSSNRYLEIFCERGWIRTSEDMIGPIDVQTPGGLVTLSAEEVAERSRQRGRLPHTLPHMLLNPYFQQNLAFLHALQENQPPYPGLEEAVAAHVLVDAVYQSAGCGEPVAV